MVRAATTVFFIPMNRRTILQLTLAAVLVLQAFAWTPPANTVAAEQDNLPHEQLVYRSQATKRHREPLRLSF